MKKYPREQYYFDIVEVVRKRGTCDRGQAGAILVKDGRIITTGYVGSPAGTPECGEVGHIIQERRIPFAQQHRHCIRTVHAEMNCIIQAAKFGQSIQDSIMYCTMFPCYECAKVIVNAGILEVHSYYPYQDMNMSQQLLTQAGIIHSIKEDKPLVY